MLESGPGQVNLVWEKGQTAPFLRLGALRSLHLSHVPAASSTSRISTHGCPPRWLLSSGMLFLLFARPKSSMSPWTACASPLQRAFSSGRGRATATLILLKKSSLWTIYRLHCCPSQCTGEGCRVSPAHTSFPPVVGPWLSHALKCPPEAF